MNRELNAGRSKSRFRVAATIFDGYDVGVIPSGFVGNDCPSWSERISIFMDCEDRRPATSMTGDPVGKPWWSTSWSIDGNKNLWMVFCRVDGRLFQADMLPGEGIYPYALLKLGYQSLPYAALVVRHFDNEDSGNTNTYVGDINPNISDQNTTLSFHYFFTAGWPNTGGIEWPDLGFSYGVIGRNCCMPFPYVPMGGARISIDDEDSGNANWMTQNGVSVSSAGPIVGGGNTTIYTARRK